MGISLFHICYSKFLRTSLYFHLEKAGCIRGEGPIEGPAASCCCTDGQEWEGTGGHSKSDGYILRTLIALFFSVVLMSSFLEESPNI